MEIDCRKVASGITLKFATYIIHIPLSVFAKNNSGTTKTLETVMSFVNKLLNFAFNFQSS
jgi:hypothetical protein